MSVRQCTKQYKIEPILAAVRGRLGLGPGERVRRGTAVEQWLGISVDEIGRVQENRLKYITNRHPLVDHNLSRQDCHRWLREHHPDIPVGKSSCTGCPYHDQETWRRIALEQPEEFAEAVAIDRAMRRPGHRQKVGNVYLHRARVPLDEAVKMSASTPGLFDDVTDLVCDGGHCFI